MADRDADSANEASAAAVRAFNIELWILYGTGVLITALRTYSQWKSEGWRNFRADEYLVWIAVLFYTCQSTLAYSIVAFADGLANNGMTEQQRASLLPNDPEYSMRVLGSQIQVAGWTCYSLLIGLLKLSMLTFYIRLTNGLSQRYRRPIWVGFFLVAITIVASVLTILLSCWPVNRYWQIHPDPGNVCQAAVSRPIIWTTFSSNVVTDLYLIAIPIPLLWESRLRLVNKVVCSIVLGAGIFVLVCATLKTYFVFEDSANGAQLAGEWGTREAFVAVCTTNLPIVFHLLKMWLKPLFGNILRSSAQTPNYTTPSGFRTIGGGSHRQGYKERRSLKSSETTGDILWAESEEQMLPSIKMQALDVSISSLPSSRPEHGIIVSNEVQVTCEDRDILQNDRIGYIQETWRPAGL